VHLLQNPESCSAPCGSIESYCIRRGPAGAIPGLLFDAIEGEWCSRGHRDSTIKHHDRSFARKASL
jgi:hypothetical protein